MERQGLLEEAKKAVDVVTWIPDWGRARIDAMLESRPDWCVSRQRTWGAPIPLFVNKIDGSLHPNSVSLIEDVAVRIESRGVDAWFDLEPVELLGDEA